MDARDEARPARAVVSYLAKTLLHTFAATTCLAPQRRFFLGDIFVFELKIDSYIAYLHHPTKALRLGVAPRMGCEINLISGAEHTITMRG